MTSWRGIKAAPVNQTIRARIPGHGDNNLIAWIPDVVEDAYGSCGSWVFMSDQEPPPDWTDGYCWAVNEDGVRSTWPTHWKPVPKNN